MPVHRIYIAPSPFNASELAELDFEQTADVTYYAHRNHAPTKGLRYGHTDWRFATVGFGPVVPTPTGMTVSRNLVNTDSANSGAAYFPEPASYCVTAIDDETGQESRPTSPLQVTNDLNLKKNYNTIRWNAVTNATYYRIYKSENTGAYGLIGTTTSTEFRDNNIGADLSEAPPVGDNPFAAAGDYPAHVAFHEQRSWWANTRNAPNALFASRSADYENMDFSRPGREDDALSIGLVATKVNAVNNLVSFKQGLLALTSHNIFSIQGANEDYITATPPPRVRPEIKRGASTLKPISLDSVTFYETAKSGEIRALGYQFEIDGVKSDDVTIFSRHLFAGHGIVCWDFIEKPLSALVTVRDDGTALAMTFDASQEVWGWTRWTTDGAFKGVCSIYEGGEDRLYFLVERNVGGEAKLYVERMASALWEDQQDACYLDCAKTYVSDEPIATVDRLDHLEGRDVVAWVDGNKVAGLTVTDGSVTLPNPGTVITVGLPFTALVETLPLAMQTGSGWNVARPQEAKKAILRVVRSRGIEYSADGVTYFPVKQRELEELGEPTDLFTGDLECDMSGETGREARVFVRSTDPSPLFLSAVMIEPDAGDM